MEPLMRTLYTSLHSHFIIKPERAQAAKCPKCLSNGCVELSLISNVPICIFCTKLKLMQNFNKVDIWWWFTFMGHSICNNDSLSWHKRLIRFDSTLASTNFGPCNQHISNDTSRHLSAYITGNIWNTDLCMTDLFRCSGLLPGDVIKKSYHFR